MRERGLDALVVRAPDNVLYLTNFWGMKGYDAVVFPAEGEPTLICLEPSREDAERTAWTTDLRLFAGYDERDPRPPSLRALELAAATAEQYEAVGIELSLGTQATDRMVGEPTTFPKAWFDAFPHAQDATPLLNEARMIKTPQELERMRLANDIAAAAMEHVQGVIRPGMTEAQVAAEWLGFVHGEGTGWAGKVDLALRLLARLVGRRDQDVHRHDRPARRRGRADAVRDLGLRRRLLGRPHEEPRRRRALRPLSRARAGADGRLRRRGRRSASRARACPSSTGASATASQRSASRASRRTRSATASALARTSRRTRTRPAAARCERAWFLQSSQDATGRAAAGLRVEDNFLITGDGRREAVRASRTGSCRHDDPDREVSGSTEQGLDGRPQREGARSAAARHRRPLRHDAARRRAVGRRRARRPRRSSRSRARSTRPGSTGSRRASRASRPTTGGPSS